MDLKKEQRIKNFFRAIYEPIIIKGNNLKDNEEIVIAFLDGKTGIMEQKSFNNIDDIILYLRGNKQLQYCETYFNIHTTNGNRKKEDIRTATAIGLDFDRKDFKAKGIDLTIDYIQGEFRKNNLYYNIIIDTGNGYHCYILLEPTQDIDLVTQVTKQIAELTGADINGCKPTQLLRIPTTWNNKQLNNNIRKPVNLVHIDENIHRKDINILYKKLNNKSLNSNKTPRTFKGTSCKKIEDLTSAPCTNRHENLLFLHGQLKRFGNSQSQIEIKLNQFQELNKLEDWDYQIEYLKNYNSYGYCSGCKYMNECYKYIESDFEFSSNYKVFKLAETTTKYLKKSTRKGSKNMNGNQILVYSILKCHSDGLFKDELVEELSYKNKKLKIDRVALSNMTLIKTLKELEENNFISVETVGRKKLYRVKETRNKLDLTYSISFGATFECIKGFISTDELRLYNYMRYLHNKEQRENPEALKGNILRVNQTELAKDIGVTQGRISQMIENLLNEKIISIWYRGKSENNGFEYYVYRLNY